MWMCLRVVDHIMVKTSPLLSKPELVIVDTQSLLDSKKIVGLSILDHSFDIAT
jgi:hypothetical protein